MPAKKKITQRVSETITEVETVPVEIVSPVHHDNERLAVGTVHALELPAAEALIKIGAVKPAAPLPAKDAGAASTGAKSDAKTGA